MKIRFVTVIAALFTIFGMSRKRAANVLLCDAKRARIESSAKALFRSAYTGSRAILSLLTALDVASLWFVNGLLRRWCTLVSARIHPMFSPSFDVSAAIDSDVLLAAAHGHIGMLKTMHHGGRKFTVEIMARAASAGQLDCLRFLTRIKCPRDVTVANAAAFGGHIACLKYLKGYRPLGRYVAEHAAKGGKLEVLRFLWEHRCLSPRSAVMTNEAAMSGNVECLEFLESVGCCNYEEAFLAVPNAASCGSVECVKFLLERGCVKSSEAVIAAASGGHLECLKFCLDHGFPAEAYALDCAIRGGHVACVKFMCDVGFRPARTSVTEACRIQRVDILETLAAHSAVFYYDHLCMVSRSGNLDALRVLVRQVKPDLSSLRTADLFNRREAVEFLYSRIRTQKPGLEWAIKAGDVDGVDFERTASEWPIKASEWAAKYGRVELLRRMLDHGCGMTPRAIAIAKTNGYADVESLLRERGCIDHEEMREMIRSCSLGSLVATCRRGVIVDERAVLLAIQCRDLNAVHAFFGAGCEMGGEMIDRTVQFDSVEMLENILKQRQLANAPVYAENAARNGSLGILQLMLKCEWPVRTHALNVAALNRHTHVVQYLLSKGVSPGLNGIRWSVMNDDEDMLRLLLKRMTVPRGKLWTKPEDYDRMQKSTHCWKIVTKKGLNFVSSSNQL